MKVGSEVNKSIITIYYNAEPQKIFICIFYTRLHLLEETNKSLGKKT
tara:strand:- start:68 stop:208 length:141 start_codon:yes stop_codon:yes gene_type:complete